MLRIKDGVSLEKLRPEIVVGLMVAASIYDSVAKDCTITSVNDSTHMAGSLHYEGLAVDLRISNLDPGQPQTLRDRIALAAGPDFDVVLEKDHIHMEWDPK